MGVCTGILRIYHKYRELAIEYLKARKVSSAWLLCLIYEGCDLTINAMILLGL